MKPLLTVNNVKLTIDERPILRGVNLVVNEGEIHAILGPNGAGKSTLASLIMGINELKSPDEGEIIFKDKLLNGLEIYERAKLGVTLAWQEPARFEGITVEEYLKLSGRNNPELDVVKCLELVGLDCTYLSRFVDDTLSGGERKRVELASILAMRPKLAVLDEPDSGIDFASMEDIANMIKTMRENGTTVLMITHREEIAEIADRATLMCDGRVVQTGNPKEIGEKFKTMCVKCEVRNPELVGGK
ncbi:Iron-regulated ABC transporter ATPase subunit SufC [Balnearium lithotrophicum]|uniref:Iron-regulated ABC transporter ATPase subunit SufC n=1 Tax=Balnearium lithotrophicum TaxID=223788 RepID=A0A521AL29_9BACT|nr:ABC transporter ATP-binding protein [Balnearium lithotrophicum]SMO35493.1 Iron-regulated ABC transporter ATPase subunit SufC [Balnearium lithotrophicum]